MYNENKMWYPKGIENEGRDNFQNVSSKVTIFRKLLLLIRSNCKSFNLTLFRASLREAIKKVIFLMAVPLRP